MKKDAFILGGRRVDRRDPAHHTGGVGEKHPKLAGQIHPRGIINLWVM